MSTLPYCEPLVAREPGPRQIPEPPRRGEPGGPPCRICAGQTTAAVWADENWTLHPPVSGGESLGSGLAFTHRKRDKPRSINATEEKLPRRGVTEGETYLPV